jgi:hypothetical protein
MTVPTLRPVTKLLHAANSHHTGDFLAISPTTASWTTGAGNTSAEVRLRNGATGNSSARKYRYP